MTKHFNPSIVERLNRIFRPKAGDQFTDEVSGPVAVIPVTPVSRIVKQAGSNVSGNVPVYTTPSDKDFYLTSVTLSYSKNVTCDVANGAYRLSVVIDGVTTYIASIALQTLTADNSNLSLNLSTPVKIDRGTSIATTNSFTAGAFIRQVCISGYTEEVTST